MKEQSIRYKIADLAMLAKSEDNFDNDIRDLISLADRLSDREIENEEKESDAKNYLSLREDSVEKCMNKQDLLALAPAVNDGYIFVPSIMEGE